MRSLALAVLLCTLTPAIGRAQDADDGTRARELFRRGVEAAEAGDWEEARARFTETYAMLPRPQVLLNLAGALAQTGRLTAAAEAYAQLTSGALDVPEEIALAARDALAILDARIPRLTLGIAGALTDDVVRLDELVLAPGERDGEHAVDPGRHAVIVLRAGDELTREDFRLYEGERLQLDLRVPDPPAPAQERRPTPARVEDPEEWWESPIFWTIAGVVVAGGVGIAVAVSIQPEAPFVGNLPPGTISVR